MKLHTRNPQRTSYEEALSLFPSSSHHHQQPLPLSEATVLDIHRLQRITSFVVHASGSRHGHRTYIVDVSKQSMQPTAPSYPASSTYQVRFASSTLRELRTQLTERTHEARTCFHCPMCTTLIDELTSAAHSAPGRFRQIAERSSHELARVEALISLLLDHVALSAAGNAAHCVGCEWCVKLIAALLRETYERSTGLI